MTNTASQRTRALANRLAPLVHFFSASSYARHGQEPGACLFATGDPQELPLPAFVDALREWAKPRDAHWFGYKLSEPGAQAAAAAGLRERLGMPFEPEDIALTNGAFTGLAASLTAVTDPGDEVVFMSPPWFWYEALVLMAGAVPVRVMVDADTHDLDLDAIEAALTPRTRAIIVNSPNNPTGKIYPPDTLRGLAERLERASQRNSRTIYLFSDEAYSRILYDGRQHHSPAQYYPNTLVIYTYGKTLLTPGQRLGYVALPPTMPEREVLRQAVLLGQLVTGYGFPNALLQHALPELERMSIDVDRLQRRRDRMVSALRGMGYDLHVPDGTFYLLPRSPLADDLAFVERLAERRVFVLPGSLVEMPGYFRISLTASDEMVEQALPVFAEAMEAAKETV